MRTRDAHARGERNSKKNAPRAGFTSNVKPAGGVQVRSVRYVAMAARSRFA